MGNCCASPGGGKTSKKNKPNPFAADYSVHQRSEINTKVYVLKDPTGRDIHAHYDLGRELGRGEFGITYLATDLSSGEKYACKSILKKKLRTNVDVEDVRREVEIMKQLPKHPNIVTLKDSYEDDNAVHIVMELCEGGELFDRIVARGHYTERAAALVTKTIVEVVQMCQRGIRSNTIIRSFAKSATPTAVSSIGVVAVSRNDLDSGTSTKTSVFFGFLVFLFFSNLATFLFKLSLAGSWDSVCKLLPFRNKKRVPRTLSMVNYRIDHYKITSWWPKARSNSWEIRLIPASDGVARG